MTALFKFLVLLAIFLLANLGDAFTNPSSAAENLVRANHLVQFEESMSKPTNEPCCKPNTEPIKHSGPPKSKWQPQNNYQQEAVSNSNDRGFCKLIVKYIRAHPNFERALASSSNITDAKISLHFFQDYKIFCEGEWEPCARMGIYVGRSPSHAANVSLILNPQTGHISPQFHVVYNDDFTTVHICVMQQSLHIGQS
jgi:hypothetical protein